MRISTAFDKHVRNEEDEKHMFTIKKCSLGTITLIQLLNQETGERISVAPEFGGNVNEIVLRKGNRSYSILDGYKTPSELVENTHFKGAKLVPFPNRVRNGKYTFDGRSYKLPLDRTSEDHAIHGFVYNKTMKVCMQDVSEESALLQLRYLHDGKTSGYPFQFKLNIMYELTCKHEFICTTTIKNIDDCPIPVADGWHPYFKTNGSVDSLFLKIPAQSITEVDPEFIPTGNTSSANDYNKLCQIGDSKFDICFQLEPSEGYATTEVYDHDSDVKIEIWQETGNWKYNYLQIYIPPSRSSIGIEPMTSNIDAFNNKEGLIELQPDESFNVSFGVRLS